MRGGDTHTCHMSMRAWQFARARSNVAGSKQYEIESHACHMLAGGGLFRHACDSIAKQRESKKQASNLLVPGSCCVGIEPNATKHNDCASVDLSCRPFACVRGIM